VGKTLMRFTGMTGSCVDDALVARGI